MGYFVGPVVDDIVGLLVGLVVGDIVSLLVGPERTSCWTCCW